MKAAFGEKWSIILAFTAVYVIWGSTYLAIWIGLNGLPPFLLSGIRFLVAGLILMSWCNYKRESLPERDGIVRSAVCGMLMLLGGTVSVVWAEQYLSSSMAAIVASILPFWFVVFDRKQWSFYFSNKSIVLGLLLGCVGISVLFGLGNSSAPVKLHQSNQLEGIIVIFFGGIAWTSGSLYSKYRPVKAPLLMNGAIQLISSGILCTLISMFMGEWKHFSIADTNLSSWLALSYLIVMGSIVTYLSYLYLLKKRPAAQVSTYVYINPVIAVLLGAVLANESITWIKVIGLLVILAGVLLVNMPKYRIQST